MSDPGRFVDESFRTPNGESSPSTVTEGDTCQQEDTGASPELTTRSGRKRRFPVQTKSSTKKSKMAKPVTSAEIEAIIKASVGELTKNMGGMEGRLIGQLDQVDWKISKTNEELGRLDSRVTAQEARNDARIEKLERIVLGQVDGPSSSGSSTYLVRYGPFDRFHSPGTPICAARRPLLDLPQVTPFLAGLWTRSFGRGPVIP